MQEPVEQRGDGGGVAEELAPLVDRPVGGEHRRGPLVAAHNQLEQVLGGGLEQLAHAEVVDDEQVRAGQLGEVVLAGVGERRLGEFFEEGVRFAVEDAVALLDRGAPDRLGKMTLARTGLADQEDVLALCDEACGGELEDECAVDLLVEGRTCSASAPGTATVATPCTARRTAAPPRCQVLRAEEHPAVQADQREPLGIPDGPAERFDRRRPAVQ